MKKASLSQVAPTRSRSGPSFLRQVDRPLNWQRLEDVGGISTNRSTAVQDGTAVDSAALQTRSLSASSRSSRTRSESGGVRRQSAPSAIYTGRDAACEKKKRESFFGRRGGTNGGTAVAGPEDDHLVADCVIGLVVRRTKLTSITMGSCQNRKYRVEILMVQRWRLQMLKLFGTIPSRIRSLPTMQKHRFLTSDSGLSPLERAAARCTRPSPPFLNT